ncbi:hypothetical protein DNI29_04275 [Hymenobacter sediminis]|uniref:hypothetical protein n=1 Tax=Hymenobacter sediminis TaxID=2218621 RepID=UPI000DA65269|nr:hypothetical protein [Hymenobacter sediminis]RPD50019.1 hypothetical protein DNI29_04275 [Hymenobacter sediminis]
MNIYTERQGILVTEKGAIHLRHDGALREVKSATPSSGDASNAFNLWAVEFTDGTKASIGQPTMGAALTRRMMECPASVIGLAQHPAHP